jgi:DNA-binding NarL/FixJ family response regulator
VKPQIFVKRFRRRQNRIPDLIILDVSMVDRNHIALTEAEHLLNGAKVLGISFGTDYRTRELLDSVGAVKLLDKMKLADKLIPAILELAAAGQTLITSVLPEEFSGG